jgi:hypothetical protein
MFFTFKLVLMGFFSKLLMKFLPSLSTKIQPTDDFYWTIIIFTKTDVGASTCFVPCL